MSVCLFMYYWMLYNVYVSRLVLFKTVVIEWKVWFTTVPLKALSDQIGLEMFMFLILTNNYLQFWFFYKLDLRKIYCCTESQPYVELSVLITCQAKRRRYLLYFLSDDTVVNLIFYIFYLMVPLWIWSAIYSILYDPMSGYNIRLVFTLPPRDSTLQYKRCIHFWNNFLCITVLQMNDLLLPKLMWAFIVELKEACFQVLPVWFISLDLNLLLSL